MPDDGDNLVSRLTEAANSPGRGPQLSSLLSSAAAYIRRLETGARCPECGARAPILRMTPAR